MIYPYFQLKGKQAGWWKLLLVRLFGQRVEAQDGDVKIIGYWYRGQLFIAKEIGVAARNEK